MSADPTSIARPAVPSPERRARLAWQLWLDGAVRFAPIALAGGSIVVLDRAEPTRTSHVRRVDDDGAKVWETALPFGVCAGPARSEGFIAVPCEGGHVVILDVVTGAIQGRPVSGGGEIVPPIAALGGRLWARFAGARPGLPHRLVVQSLRHDDDRLEVEDPLGTAIETHFRRTNHTIIATAEHSDGHVVLVGLDEAHASLLWRTRLEVKGVSDLWGAGGLVDLVCSDRVMSFDARSGTPLTTRFSGMNLEGARLSGETLLVLTNGHAAVGEGGNGAKPSPKRHLVSAFECANETPRGTLDGVHRVVAAGSDLLAVHLVDGPFALLELPDLVPVALPESDALEDVTHAAFSWNRAWIVGHRGQSLSALDLPL